MDLFNNWFNYFSDYEFMGMEIAAYFKVAFVFIITLVILKIFKIAVIARLKKVFKKTKTEIDDAVIDAISAIGWPFYFTVSVFFSSRFIKLPDIAGKWLFNILLIVMVFYAIRFIADLLDFGAKKITERKKEEGGQTGIIKALSVIMKIILWVGALILILSNLGYNVTSLIAGLGIGGIAIGLALQNILGDLFSSLAIHFDKPFKQGDFIIVGENLGTVKHVGIKTTRITALQGEEIIMSNTDMTSSRVQNFGQMEKRRVVFSIGVSYETKIDKLKQIPTMIKEIINQQELLELDRVNFKEFGDSSLVHEIVYYIASADYNKYMDAQEEINLEIVDKFQKENIEIAYPTTTVYLKK
ncbi:MAG: mechanosensitive ion channel family protein [Bacteroidota bacterium]|nr:mechanosensitive ion channel family protein [Bacteroidota bacterium]